MKGTEEPSYIHTYVAPVYATLDLGYGAKITYKH